MQATRNPDGTNWNYITARRRPEVPLGSAKWDGGTKSAACPHKQRTKVESRRVPGKAKMRTGSKCIAWLSKQGL